MGAAFDSQVFDHQPTQGEYDALCEQRAYDHGHGGYSGTFAEARGALTTHDSRVFASYAEASDYLDETCEKWSAGIAVPYTNEEGQQRWVVGAICSE